MRIKMIFIAVIFFTLFSIAVSFGSEKEAQKSPSAFSLQTVTSLNRW